MSIQQREREGEREKVRVREKRVEKTSEHKLETRNK